MGFLTFLASIPTASNLALKLREAEAQITVLKAANEKLELENADLKIQLEQAKSDIEKYKRMLADLRPGIIADLARRLNG